MPTVELKSAFYWICEECGINNFDIPIAAEFAPGEKAEAFRDYHGMEQDEELPDDWETWSMEAIPEQVTCKGCGTEFATIHESEV